VPEPYTWCSSTWWARETHGAIPPFVKVAIDGWTAAAALAEGPWFRRVRRRKYPEKTPAALSERMIWHIVTKYPRQTGLVEKLAPHDMRRYAESRTMPNRSEGCSFGVELLTNTQSTDSA
jgi:hypothetical protein